MSTKGYNPQPFAYLHLRFAVSDKHAPDGLVRLTHGGMTVALYRPVSPFAGSLRVGAAFCSPDDTFNRETAFEYCGKQTLGFVKDEGEIDLRVLALRVLLSNDSNVTYWMANVLRKVARNDQKNVIMLVDGDGYIVTAFNRKGLMGNQPSELQMATAMRIDAPQASYTLDFPGYITLLPNRRHDYNNLPVSIYFDGNRKW